MLRYSIIGTGAVGGYFGARLARAGAAVRFLARSDYEAIKSHGLNIDSVAGSFSLPAPEVYSSTEHMPESDVVAVAVKTTSNGELPKLLAPLIKPGTVILIMQNGLGEESAIQAAFPEALVLGALCYICAWKDGPGSVVHRDKGTVTLGALSGRHDDDETRREALQQIARDFALAGVPADISDSLGTSRWRKLLWNIPFNGLSVTLDADTREIMASPSARRMAARLMEEVMRGAAAAGFPLEPEAAKKMLAYTETMTPYKPSMKLDWEAQRPMEIESMYRNPVRAARSAGVELHAIAHLADELEYMEARRAVSRG